MDTVTPTNDIADKLRGRFMVSAKG